MKKLSIIIMLSLVMLVSTLPVNAQYGRRLHPRRHYSYYSHQQCGNFLHRHDSVMHPHSKSCIRDRHKHDRNFWNKHRDTLTVLGGAGTGAIIGGIAGGKKGALIGAAIGGGSAAIYTYRIRNRRRTARY
jgi:hypothetical protein